MSISDTKGNSSSSLRVTRHASRQDFSFKGKWLVRYEPGEFTYHALLAALHRLQILLDQQGLEFEFLNIRFSRNISSGRFYRDQNQLCIESNGNDKQLVESVPGAFACQATLEPLAKPIRSLNLLFPRLDSDPRWKTIGLPAAQLFLAGSLQANGFQPMPMPLRLPSSKLPPGALSADMAGFTVFEDLLPALRLFLADFQANYGGWLAAGGPFPTLHPLAAVYHLPQINLFIRGEAELELPAILDALNKGDAPALFERQGWFWQKPGLIAMSSFDEINRPEDFSSFQVDLAFMQREHLRHGLEMNFSRGCTRGCIFCCRAQGNIFRKLPLEKIDELLKKYSQQIEKSIEKSKSPRIPPLSRGDKGGIEISGSECGRVTNPLVADRSYSLGKANDRSCPPLHEPGASSTERFNSHSDLKLAYPVNINDDDILQDPDYTAAVFALIKKNGFRIHGIQTSPTSLVDNDGRLNEEILSLVADPELYVENRPLLWLGSDVFLPQRGPRLGKRLPSLPAFASLLAGLEKHGLRHYHYWISSDGDSTWEEFVEELALIVAYHRDFPNFSLLAHAPFVVPYPASRLWQRLPANTPQLMIREVFRAVDPQFNFVLPERLETGFANLNRLLRNEKAGGHGGFFDFMKEKNFAAAAQLAYHFLKQEQLQGVATDQGLDRAQERLEKVIGELLELRDA